MTIPDYTIRQATPDDAEIIAGQRRAMFIDMGHRDLGVLDAMTAHFLPWVKPRIESGEYLAWFAMSSDQSVAAGLGVWLMD